MDLVKFCFVLFIVLIYWAVILTFGDKHIQTREIQRFAGNVYFGSLCFEVDLKTNCNNNTLRHEGRPAAASGHGHTQQHIILSQVKHKLAKLCVCGNNKISFRAKIHFGLKTSLNRLLSQARHHDGATSNGHCRGVFLLPFN